MSVQKINSPERPLVPMYSHAVKIPGLIFCSGQTPVDSAGNVVPGDIKAHAAQCLSNLGDVLKTAGSSWDKVVKVNIYLKSMSDYAAVNEEYIKLMPDPKPARTCIQAGGLPFDVDIEIEAIAAV
ncbi:Endoribonuclease L-PSP [Suillus clintonianus]|uniref:Endoribonuclease L-PSP n=1 Tax=Suillus clintonianus TaxID=1904413 RepID=UPI001B876DC2|nr:Endoribonuclease L-PSP [Suillus clintonianus]KAG2154811.1 Endoribonuclease L-PSP [Suillus clintonianus]